MKKNLNKLDNGLINFMRSTSIPAIRLSFGVIFIWFGILKPLGLSSAEGLLKATVIWLPFGSPDIWLIIIGFWEVVIGIFFFFKKTTRIAIILLFLQNFILCKWKRAKKRKFYFGCRSRCEI